MKVKVDISDIKGEITAPCSKSMAHRYLICAGLSKGKSVILDIAYSEDILATLDCLETLGAKIERLESSVIIEGVSPFIETSKEFFCRESGSTLRFFIPILLLSKNSQSFYGSERLMERPLSVYENLSKEKGFIFNRDGQKLEIKGMLQSGNFEVEGNVSSQFISGLLFALPFCKGDSEIKLIKPIESKSYIDMTISAMARFGVRVLWKNDDTLYIKGSQHYTAKNLSVEGDWSNAAFFDALNFMGGSCVLNGLLEDSLQGDKIYREYFSLLKEGTPELDISNCPDLAPILMTLATYFNGAKLTGTARLKIKESDRGEVMAKELKKFGADISVYDNEILIRKKELHAPKDELCSHNDHRIVMSLCVLSLKFSGVIDGAEAVNKSFPDFFNKIREVSGKVTEYDN